MITEDTYIDYERIADIIPPSVSSVLAEVYGSDLCQATVEECLVLVEATALSLREGGRFCDNLRAVVYQSMDMPCGIYTSAEMSRNEGLKLLAILQVTIVEHYSAATFQPKI